ncbi:hypothetical protein TNCV_2752041 [Trichonephila clavipes]|nr:hypothetical protein TNCV_2752041 [Trichonephila clavipes]
MLEDYNFQQDGTPCHYPNNITHYFNAEVLICIGRGTVIFRLPRLPLDFSIWGFVKDPENTSSCHTSIPELKSRICAAILFDRQKRADKSVAGTDLLMGHLYSNERNPHQIFGTMVTLDFFFYLTTKRTLIWFQCKLHARNHLFAQLI